MLFQQAVLANEALAALAEQLAFTIPQGQYPNDYWSLAKSLGDDIIGGKYKDMSDEELTEILTQFEETCISYAEPAEEEEESESAAE